MRTMQGMPYWLSLTEQPNWLVVCQHVSVAGRQARWDTWSFQRLTRPTAVECADVPARGGLLAPRAHDGTTNGFFITTFKPGHRLCCVNGTVDSPRREKRTTAGSGGNERTRVFGTRYAVAHLFN